MKKEVKINFIDKLFLRFSLPNLNKYKKEDNSNKRIRLKFVDINRYNYLEKLSTRTVSYIEQIKEQFKNIEENDNRIEELVEEVKEIKEVLKIKEDLRRKSASKTGGLQASLNKEKQKNKELLDYSKKLNEELDLKDLELTTKDAEIKMLRGKGKKSNVEDYKNYFECRRELERRKKG